MPGYGSPVGIQIDRYGKMLPNSSKPSGANAINPINSPGVAGIPFYESGPFWVLVFLTVGYILVYRTIR